MGDKDGDKEECPACTPETRNLPEFQANGSLQWVRCDACKIWYHWPCAGNGDELESINKWFCKPCQTANPKRAITHNNPARKSARKRTVKDSAAAALGSSDAGRWLRMMEGKPVHRERFRRMQGRELGTGWLAADEGAMKEPVVIESPEGLGMRMPPASVTVEDIAEKVGGGKPLDVIDVATQSAAPGWTLDKWSDYVNTEPSKRERILNVISLEVSDSALGTEIAPPRLVRELDWVENCWPTTRKGKGHVFPKVQLYCLMGVQGAWTDWHVDFAGSSVYYHVVKGAKTFYFVRPSPANLAAYEKWSGSEIQNYTWLGDMVDEVVKVDLVAGNTMIIPTGWIHAVYTPEDTLVFGGNFLHSYNVATQLRVREIEISTQVPKKFRFPMFTKLCWYVAEKTLRDIKAGAEHSPRVRTSLLALAQFLVSEARVLERGLDGARREAEEQIPKDKVKDAPAVARELRWRLQAAAGILSDDEERLPVPAKKRGRGESDTSSEEPEHRPFRHFRPRAWDKLEEEKTDETKEVLGARRLGEDEREVVVEDAGGATAEVFSRKHVLTRMRRIEHGLEKERIERTVDRYVWHAV